MSKGKESDKTDTQKKIMLEALERSLGIVTTASKKAGISRDTHYRWMKEDPEYKRAVEDVSEMALDMAESKLHESIIEGNIASIIFYLKTKGKRRGYVERMEVEDKTPIAPDLSGYTNEDLIALLNDNGSAN